MGDAKSLAHTKWNCKYHIVFAPKYRRQVFYGEKKRAVGEILRKLCEWKGVKIFEAECCPDHTHMLLEIPPKMSVSSFMGYMKGKSSLMLYEQFGDLKFKYRNREFWCRGYTQRQGQYQGLALYQTYKLLFKHQREGNLPRSPKPWLDHFPFA